MKFVYESYPLIVAEMGANHLQDPDRALAIVRAAAASGCQAIKLQTYQADTMVHRNCTRTAGGPWGEERLLDLYKRAEMPWSWTASIFALAHELRILPFSTPYDREAVDFLERLGCRMYKIASFEILDLDLIRYAAETGKELVISTGMATLEEITDAVEAAALGGCSGRKLTLLRCTSAYPADPREANLITMHNLREHFHCRVGLSDHTQGAAAAIAAALLGADMIEKHLGLGDNGQFASPDVGFSLNPQFMAAMISSIKDAIDAVGNESFGPTKDERPMLELRRTLHVAYDMKAGDELTAHNVRALRPGDGLAPKYRQQLLGMKVCRDVIAGEPLTWELVRGPIPRKGET